MDSESWQIATHAQANCGCTGVSAPGLPGVLNPLAGAWGIERPLGWKGAGTEVDRTCGPPRPGYDWPFAAGGLMNPSILVKSESKRLRMRQEPKIHRTNTKHAMASI